MKTPFTSDQFFQVLAEYNRSVFPWQGFIFIAGVYVVYRTINPNTKSDKIVSLTLSLLWLWMGIMYHLLFFTTINNAAYGFGAFFIIQAGLFMYAGVANDNFSFEFKSDRYGMSGIALIIYALIIYPILGYYLGHVYPASPTFGLPCPTTIFTFGVLLLSKGKCPMAILIIPVAWSFIGFMAAFNFGVLEDTGLIIAALYTVPMLMFRNRKVSARTGN